MPAYYERYVKMLKRVFRIHKQIWLFSKSFVFLNITLKLFSLLTSYLILYINKLLINELSNVISKNTTSNSFIYEIIIIVLAIDILSTLIISIFQYYIGKKKLQYDDEMIIKIACSISNLDMEYYDNPNHYNQTSLAFQYSNSILGIFNKTIDFVFAIFSLIISVTLISSVSIILTFIAIISVIPSFFIRKRINYRNFLFGKELTQEKRYVDYLSSLMLNKTIIREMQIYQTQQYFKEKAEHYQKQCRNLKLKNSLKNAKSEFVIVIMEKAISFVQQILLIVSIVRNSLTIGDYSYVGGIIENLKGSFGQILGLINELQITDKQFQEFVAITNRKPYISTDGMESIKGEPKVLSFNNISFKYPNTDTYALRNISFEYHFKDKIALVGPNGSGKSTLVKLLLRFYDPTEGEILLDGINIKKYDIDQYRNVFSVMFQEPYIYGLSIEENIALCDSTKIDANKVKEILHLLNLPYDIDLNRLYGREFNAEGYVFSLGQQQRLFAARTLYHHREMFILDEPAASMDALSEYDFFEALNKYACNSGIIYITHRYGILKNMDKIFVLDNAELIESGSHFELISKNGLYAQLYKLQEREFQSSNIESKS